MQYLKNPENYHPAKEQAAWLRAEADKLEKQGGYVNIHINMWFADANHVRRSMDKKFPPKTEVSAHD